MVKKKIILADQDIAAMLLDNKDDFEESLFPRVSLQCWYVKFLLDIDGF